MKIAVMIFARISWDLDYALHVEKPNMKALTYSGHSRRGKVYNDEVFRNYTKENLSATSRMNPTVLAKPVPCGVSFNFNLLRLLAPNQ